MIEATDTLSETKSRNVSLDVIRGCAVLGMIFINIMVFVPDINEIIWARHILGYTTSETSVYNIIYVLFNGKMRAMFALLFGVGIIIFFQSKTDSTTHKSDFFARRMFWLLVFGLMHAYFSLWPGSILFEYAACGLLLFSFRGLHAYTLMVLSFCVLGFYIYLNSKDYSKSYERYKGYETALQLEREHKVVPEDIQKQKESFEHYLAGSPPLSQTKKEEMEANKQSQITIFTSGLPGIYKQNTNTANEALSFGVYLNIFESIGTMLLGMALFKLDFFEFKRRKYVHAFLMIIGIPLGVWLYSLLYRWLGNTQQEIIETFAWKTFSSFTVEGVARIILSLGYCSLLIFLCSVHIFKPVTGFIANVGRMAFSNYVGQTVICVFFFYGLKYYGSLSITGLAQFSLCIILFQLIVSYVCIRYFKSGPIEYAWRKLAKKNLPE